MKLDSEHRKELKETDFGLPSERKYPLIDEAHVRKAIQYFKFCPPGKRSELANNINKKARKLGMKIKVSKSSPFIRYAARDILRESFNDDWFVNAERQSLVDYYEDTDVDGILEELEAQTQMGLSRMFINLFTNVSIEALLEIEKSFIEILTHDNPFAKLKQQVRSKEHSINPYFIINKTFKSIYELVLSFVNYNTDIDLKNTRLIESIFDDVTASARMALVEGKDSATVIQKLQPMLTIVDNYDCNHFIAVRNLLDLAWECFLLQTEFTSPMYPVEEYSCRVDSAMEVEGYINAVVSQILNKPHSVAHVIAIDKGFDLVLKQSGNMNMINMNNYLRTLKKEMESQLNIIYLNNDFQIRDAKSSMINFQLRDYYKDNNVVVSFLQFMDGALRKDNIRLYNKNFTLCLDSKDLMSFIKLRKFEKLFVGQSSDKDPIYYGLLKHNLYLLAKDREDCCTLYLIELIGEKQYVNTDNFLCLPENFDTSNVLKAIKITLQERECTQPEILTEGLFISKDGDIKFKLNPKKSYMDEYSENHKILIENFKAENYDGLKVNLAFHFALINHIERDLHFYDKNKFNKLSTNVRSDAEKARMFAMNDFKTYMRELLKKEPSFDFTKYYQEGDFGKTIVEFKNEEIQGIKRLFQTIMSL